MTNITDEQRIDKVEELLKQISPLNYERVFLETSLHFSKESYFQNYDERKKAEIIDTEQKLNIINHQLTPLFSQLRQHQILYFVQYEGEFSQGNEQTYWQTQSEYLYLKTNCNIDTTTSNGWTPFINEPSVKLL